MKNAIFAVVLFACCAASLPQREIDALCDIAKETNCNECLKGCGACGATCNNKATNIVELQLRNAGMTSLPRSVNHFKHLELLNVEANPITELPDISNLTALLRLEASGCYLSALPETLGRLKSLTHLSCDYNRLSTFPDSFAMLNGTLRELTISSNKFTALPESLGRFTSLSILQVPGNPIKGLPNLGALVNIRELAIGGIQLSTVPAYFANFVKLTNLDENHLLDIPDFIGNLTSLLALSFQRNFIYEIPETFSNLKSLSELAISDNELTAFPDALMSIPALYKLSMKFNMLTAIPNWVSFRFIQMELGFNFLDCDVLNFTGPYSTSVISQCNTDPQRTCDGLDRRNCILFPICKWNASLQQCFEGTDCVNSSRGRCSECLPGFGPDPTNGVCQECGALGGTFSMGTQPCKSCLVNHCTACSPITGECHQCKYLFHRKDRCVGITWVIASIVGVSAIVIMSVAIPSYIHLRRYFKRRRASEEAAALLVPAGTPQRSLVGLAHFECNDGAGLGVTISPSVLTFGSSKRPLAINETVEETLAIVGIARHSQYRILLPESCPERYKLDVPKLEGTVAGRATVLISAKLTLPCTTKLDTKMFVVINERHFTEVAIRADSALSCKFDATELDIGTLLGTGGFGSVYRGVWRGMPVAVKSYNETVVNDEVMRGDIEREVEMCTALRHPNVVSFFGSARSPGRLFIVMELVEHGSLDRMVKSGPLEPRFKVRVLLDIARGMDFLHQNKIIHRDLKTANVLVTSTDPTAQVCGKLSDFNTSRFLGADSCTKTKGVGTPVFMAPEVLNATRYTMSADVYSFGILVWHVWTQAEPYHELPDQFSIIQFVLTGKRLSVPSDTPAGIRGVIEASWAAEPSTRPTFQQLVRDITAASATIV